MRRIRCYLSLPLTVGAVLRLPVDSSNHLLRVLRLGIGDEVILFNGDGHDYHARLLTVAKSGADVEVLAMDAVQTESNLRIHLGQALARGDKMDWVLQKATELGVAAITPLITQRSEVKLSGERADKRIAHWRGVMASAAEQCGRARLPELGDIQRLDAWCVANSTEPGWYLDPLAEDRLDSLQLPAAASTRLLIGPEGGLDDSDIETLKASGLRGLRLGPRVLRTETAGLAAIAALQAVYGDFRG